MFIMHSVRDRDYCRSFPASESGQVHTISGNCVLKLWARSRDLPPPAMLLGGGKSFSIQLHNIFVGQLHAENRNQQLLEAMPGKVRQDEGRKFHGTH